MKPAELVTELSDLHQRAMHLRDRVMEEVKPSVTAGIVLGALACLVQLLDMLVMTGVPDEPGEWEPVPGERPKHPS